MPSPLQVREVIPRHEWPASARVCPACIKGLVMAMSCHRPHTGVVVPAGGLLQCVPCSTVP